MKKYTAEQIEGEVADMSAEGYPDGLRTNMLRAYAATLRQQAERGDVAVSAWREEWAGSDPGRGWYIRESTGINGRVVAYLGENIASELVREVIAAHNASLFIGKPEECADACPPQQVCDYCQAVAPLLRAPVEQGGRADAGSLAERLQQDTVLGPAALAQNAQGEAVAIVRREGASLGTLLWTPEGQKADLPDCTKLYLHAERARVPDGWKLAMFILQSGLYAKLPEEERAVCDALVQENPYIAAPSQPEDAADKEIQP